MDIRLRIAVIYLCVFVLTIIATKNLQENAENYPQFFDEGDEYLWAKVIAWVVVGAGVMIIIARSKYSTLLIKLMEFFIVFLSVGMLGFSITVPLLGERAIEMAMLSGIIATFIRVKGMLRNEIAILSTAGVSSMLGFSLSPFSAMWLFLFLAIYDYIAVFKTKHMVELATTISKTETTFSIKERQRVVVGGKEKEEFMEIGSGDLLVPALVVSAFLKLGIAYSAMVMIGTYLGLLLIAREIKIRKRILPALPYLFGGTIFTLSSFILFNYIVGLIWY